MRIPEDPLPPVDPRNLESMRKIWTFIKAHTTASKHAGHKSLIEWVREIRQDHKDGLPSKHTGRPNYPK